VEVFRRPRTHSPASLSQNPRKVLFQQLAPGLSLSRAPVVLTYPHPRITVSYSLSTCLELVTQLSISFPSFPFHVATDIEHTRARKRQRTDSFSPHTIDQPFLPPRINMRLTDSDQDSNLSASPDFAAHAGPSTLPLDHHSPSNGRTNGNGFVPPANGFTSLVTNGSHTGSKHGKAIAKVILPGTTLYDDSYVDREEFVRLVIQSLRDVGYV